LAGILRFEKGIPAGGPPLVFQWAIASPFIGRFWCRFLLFRQRNALSNNAQIRITLPAR